ncbi:MAG: peptidoglycan-binding domain-containing protein [Candidatus Omnitrophota bacterium]
MVRKNLVLLVVVMVSAAFLASGCSTVPKKFKEEVSGIKSKVDTLESRVESMESKQAESERMVNEQGQTIEDIKSAKEKTVVTNITTRSGSVKGREHTKQIQACLKNAGFYKGNIDGVKGRNTKKAIKEFQKANGLKADGVVGPKTWEALSRYESASAQSAAGLSDEGAATK